MLTTKFISFFRPLALILSRSAASQRGNLVSTLLATVPAPAAGNWDQNIMEYSLTGSYPVTTPCRITNWGRDVSWDYIYAEFRVPWSHALMNTFAHSSVQSNSKVLYNKEFVHKTVVIFFVPELLKTSLSTKSAFKQNFQLPVLQNFSWLEFTWHLLLSYLQFKISQRHAFS